MIDARVRPARASDRAPLMSFIKDVWGGHDYIPHVWDSWLKDPRGGLFVVEVGGVPVGMNRVQFLEDGSAWFQGARVHPDFRGKGLASLLGENSMRLARERGIGTFRLTTASRNWSSRRQIAKMGFLEVARFSAYAPASAHRPKGSANRVREGEEAKVAEMLEGSREFHLGHGVFWRDFVAESLSRDALRSLVQEGLVWRSRGAVAIAREGGEGRERWEEVCFLGGPPADAAGLVRALLGRNRKTKERWVFVPQKSPIVHALRGVGFRREFSQIVFERTAANG